MGISGFLFSVSFFVDSIIWFDEVFIITTAFLTIIMA